MTSLETLKQKFSDAWLKLCVNLHERFPEKGTTYLYGLLGATALAPVMSEPSYAVAVAKLTEVIGALGIETMGSLLDEFRNKKDDAERARLLEQAAQNSEQIRNVLDDLLEKVEAIPRALQIYSQQHQVENERQWFTNTLQKALLHAGSRLQIEVQVKTGADSPLAIGAKAEALSKSVKLENVQANHISIQLDASGSGLEKTFSADPQRRYLEKLQTYCNLLPLAAIAKESDPHASLRLTLDKVYIGLNTTLWVDQQGKFVQREALQSWEEQKKTRPFTTLEAAAAEPMLVILGDPGSGKSSFINHLLWQLAERQLRPNSPMLNDWPHHDRFPVRILLRELLATLQQENAQRYLAKGQEERQRQFCQIVQQHLHNMLSKDGLADFAPALQNLIASGRCLIVFDGLDEAPPDQRKLLRHAVECFCANSPHIRFLVTCRILSYEKETMLPSFNSVTLTPFDDNQIKDFITRWYQALQQLGKPVDWAASKTADLQQAVKRLPQSMVRNPLLLTTLASVHANNVELPRQRVKLYQQTGNLLLRRWQEAKADKVSLFEEIGLTEETKMLHALWELGYFGQRAGKAQQAAADIPRLEALAILERNFVGVREPGVAANRFLDYVDQTAGLLNGRGGGAERVYAFPHRTFQEYFAGCYLAKRTRDFKRELKKLLAEGDYWRLAAQLGIEELLFNDGNEGPALDAAYFLCPSDFEPQGESDWRGSSWAGHFATAIGLGAIEKDLEGGGPAFVQRLRTRLVKILEQRLLPARERADAGFVLGQLGDPREGVSTLPVWVELPGGRFMMGSNEGGDNEKPLHEVELSPFKISKYPITNAQFEMFMNDRGYDNKDWWSEAGWKYRQERNWEAPRLWRDESFNLPNQPVVGVSWFEAEAFCNWLSAESLGQRAEGKKLIVRLPTEAEWEFAARGKDGRKFPWGSDEPTPEHANYERMIGRPTAVGTYRLGATSEGIFDLAGNMWEWCLDWYGGNYYAECKKKKAVKDPHGPQKGDYRVLRGGAYYSNADGLRGSGRVLNYPVLRSHDYGFRVCVAGES
ncbi:SUMF1/EgtB/PvdO family nonheme iron enzyme [candidate division KSB1 bacterium]|nr:SUMF1/EgtB/PvdO family nonheme iron enzyme [candidate division KSB1 bacterium]